MISDNKSSINTEEVEKFNILSEKWWDASGELKTLHEINLPRLKFITDKIKAHFKIEKPTLPFAGLKVIDIGCGGGLLSEPMCRLGADVTGIDAAKKNIEVAKIHAQKQGLDIKYANITVEKHLESGKKYDIVICMEVLEHVDNVNEFIKNCCSLLQGNGLIFFSTINKTIKSYLQAIIGAEYVLKWLPIGTHDWRKFLKPSEIDNVLRSCDVDIQEIAGFKYNLFGAQKWILSKQIDVNYILYAKKT